MIELELPGGRVRFTDRTVDLRAQPDAFGPCRQGHQVHGTTVLRDASGEADGFVSTDSAWGALVRTADCLPVALASAAGVAMLHGGWRGLAGGIIGVGVCELEGPIAAALGPSARGCCYEVGEEVHAQFAAYDARRGERNLALEAVATAQLRAAGVTDIHDTGICTICDERFFSYRREGDAAGRQGGIAWPA
jgi:polyphenol oxidase